MLQARNVVGFDHVAMAARQRTGGSRNTACYDQASLRTRFRGGEGTPQVVQDSQSAVDVWVKKAQAGDVNAFESLYRAHVGRIHALCLRMSGDAREAEELTQDAFVRAWEKLDTFQGNSAFSSWLHRLAVNVVLAQWRSKGRQRERVVAITEADDFGTASQGPQTRAGIDLERAIATLPTGARTVFVLHDIEGFRHRDIAEMTGLAVGTSKAQLHRARQLLRKALRG